MGLEFCLAIGNRIGKLKDAIGRLVLRMMLPELLKIASY
jgi:hypothetical protein